MDITKVAINKLEDMTTVLKGIQKEVATGITDYLQRNKLYQNTDMLTLRFNKEDKNFFITYSWLQKEGKDVLSRAVSSERPKIWSVYNAEEEYHKEVEKNIFEYVDENYLINYGTVCTDIFKRLRSLSNKFSRYWRYSLTKTILERAYLQRVPHGTLSVHYDTLHRKYIIEYNPEFCVRSAILYSMIHVLEQGNSGYSYHNGTIDTMICAVGFFLTHEVSHILMGHVGMSSNSLASDLPHYIIQYYGDIFINNSIPYMIGHDDDYKSPIDVTELKGYVARHPIGLIDKYPTSYRMRSKYVECIPEMLLSNNATQLDMDIQDVFSSFIADTDFKGSAILDDESVRDIISGISPIDELEVEVMPYTTNLYMLMHILFEDGLSSNSYMRFIYKLLDTLLDKDAEYKQEEPDRSSGDNTDTSPGMPNRDNPYSKNKKERNEEQPNGDSDTREEGSDSSDNSSSGRFKGDENKTSKKGSQASSIIDDMKNARVAKIDESMKDALKDLLSEVLKNTSSVDNNSMRGKSDKDGSTKRIIPSEISRGEFPNVIKSYDLDISNILSQVSKSVWRRVLREKISQATGYTFERTTSLPSRKIEGLWGAQRKVPKIDNIVMLLDCSGSMSSPQFKAIFKELESLSRFPELSRATVHMIPWGNSASYKKFRGITSHTINDMYNYGRLELGGTEPYFGYEMMYNKIKKPDLIIMMSDCEMWGFNHDYGFEDGSEQPNAKIINKYLKYWATKSVYISVGNKREEEHLKYLDTNYERRLIHVDPKEARGG